MCEQIQNILCCHILELTIQTFHRFHAPLTEFLTYNQLKNKDENTKNAHLFNGNPQIFIDYYRSTMIDFIQSIAFITGC